MQTFDIRTIKTVFICPDHNEKYSKRRKHMETILAKHGFTNFMMYKSGTDYPHCLRHALYNILQQNLDNPVIIFEDDIVFHKNPTLVFDIPVNTDAFYLGVAATCMDFEVTGRNRLVETKDYDIYESFIRIKNMLSAHAVLYLNRQYKENLSKLTLTSNMPCDVDMCKLQTKYNNIYGLRFPICWQSIKYNTTDWQENITKVRFNERGCWEWVEAIEDD